MKFEAESGSAGLIDRLVGTIREFLWGVGAATRHGGGWGNRTRLSVTGTSRPCSDAQPADRLRMGCAQPTEKPRLRLIPGCAVLIPTRIASRAVEADGGSCASSPHGSGFTCTLQRLEAAQPQGLIARSAHASKRVNVGRRDTMPGSREVVGVALYCASFEAGASTGRDFSQSTPV